MAGYKGMKFHKWSDEEIAYFKEIVPNRHYDEVLELMNAKFEYQFRKSQLSGAAKRYGVKTGFTGQFEKGNIPANKGTKGLTTANKTSFKKGQKSHNYRPVGSERVSRDGYIEIKIKDPNKWELKHKWLWEQKNGVVPKGHVLIFADGDKLNCEPDNMLLITRGQLVRLNQNHLLHKDKEINETAIKIVDLIIKTSEMQKKGKK